MSPLPPLLIKHLAKKLNIVYFRQSHGSEVDDNAGKKI
jgi:hypothetical protein